MIVGFKYWDEGTDPSGLSFVNMELIRAFMYEQPTIFIAKEALDGVRTAPKRKYMKLEIEFRNPWDDTTIVTGSLTIKEYIANILTADFIRIDDSRHSGTNAIDFVSDGEAEISRDGFSEVLKRVAAAYVSKSPLTRLHT